MARFLIAVVAAAALVAGAAWLWGPKVVVASLGAGLVFLLAWPVLLFVVALLFGIVMGLLGGDGDVAGEGLLEVALWYYRRLFSLRSPLLWGGLLGGGLAVGALYGYLHIVVEPLVERATQQVAAVADALQEAQRRVGRFPVARGEYLHEALGLAAGEAWQGQELVDPWGQPLRYEAFEDEEALYYRVASSGWNRRWEAGAGDDIVRDGMVLRSGGVVKELVDRASEKLKELWRRRETPREGDEPDPSEQ